MIKSDPASVYCSSLSQIWSKIEPENEFCSLPTTLLFQVVISCQTQQGSSGRRQNISSSVRAIPQFREVFNSQLSWEKKLPAIGTNIQNMSIKEQSCIT